MVREVLPGGDHVVLFGWGVGPHAVWVLAVRWWATETELELMRMRVELLEQLKADEANDLPAVVRALRKVNKNEQDDRRRGAGPDG